MRPRADAPTVIESSAPLWSAGHGRVLADSPTVDIGGNTAVITALRLSDGRIVVAEAEPVGLRYFGADGRPLYDVGSAADGPEALRGIQQISLGRADTVAVFDVVQGALVLVDPNGGLGGRIRIHPELTPRGANGFLPKGLAPDGRYLLQTDETAYPFPAPAGSVVVDSTRIYWLDRDATLTDSTPRLFEGESFGFGATSPSGRITVLPLAVPLGPMLRVASGASGVWFGDGATWELRHADPHGHVDQLVRLGAPAVPLTPALRDSFVARYRAGRLGTDPRGLDRQFALKISESPFPSDLPAFIDLFVGADSTIWVQHAGLLEGRSGDGTLGWTLIGANGRWLGDITVPPRFRPTAAGRDWVLGVMRNEDGSARVRLYPLKER
jgi:hypothetical protein